MLNWKRNPPQALLFAYAVGLTLLCAGILANQPAVVLAGFAMGFGVEMVCSLKRGRLAVIAHWDETGALDERERAVLAAAQRRGARELQVGCTVFGLLLAVRSFISEEVDMLGMALLLFFIATLIRYVPVLHAASNAVATQAAVAEEA